MQSTQRGRLAQPYPGGKGSAASQPKAPCAQHHLNGRAPLGPGGLQHCCRLREVPYFFCRQKCWLLCARCCPFPTVKAADRCLLASNRSHHLWLGRLCRDTQPAVSWLHAGRPQGHKCSQRLALTGGSRAESTARCIVWRGLCKQQATNCCHVLQP